MRDRVVSWRGWTNTIIALTILLILAVSPDIPVVQADDSSKSGADDEAEAIELGDALASVNGVLIDRLSFHRNYARVASHSRAASAQTLALDVLNSMINQQLIVQYAESMNISIDDSQVEFEISSLQEDISGISWDTWLTQNGYGESEFCIAVFDQLLNNAVRDQVTAVLQEPAEHVHARHILAATQAQAKYVLDRLEAGDNFALMAAAVSLDVTTRDDGGDLGWFVHGELLDDYLANVAFGLDPGEVAGPVATRLGYHILQKLGSEFRNVDESRMPFIAENLFNLWLEEQLGIAEIVLNLEAIAELGN